MTISVILDLQENMYTEVPRTHYMSAGEDGPHVVGFVAFSIDVFLEVQNKKCNSIWYLISVISIVAV